MTRADEQIKSDVIAQLKSDNRFVAKDIDVAVSDGKVTLSGTVPSYLGVVAAESNAFNVRGVTHVVNELKVHHPTTMPVPADDVIAENIRSRLSVNPDINLRELQVQVNAGVVALQGTVDAYWKKIHAEYLVESEPGVIDINNYLAVVPTESVYDQNIANEIMLSIEASSAVKAEDVSVSVKDGVAVLSGIVPNWSAHKAAHEAAMFKQGVVDVENYLIVSAGEKRSFE